MRKCDFNTYASTQSETHALQSGKPDTIRESNQASGVRKTHYA